MKPEEVYLAWAPPGSLWSPWAIPVPFAQLHCADFAEGRDSGLTELLPGLLPERGRALVLDLPGAQAVRVGLGLALRGFRPVPVFDGSPGPALATAGFSLPGVPAAPRLGVAVDLQELLRWLCIGASVLASCRIAPDAPPVFLLDDRRAGDAYAITQEAFDNRWKTFPQDFPSARFLREHGIARVLLVQTMREQPKEDLAHVLLGWQEEGIRIDVASAAEADEARPLEVRRPPRFRALWYRALEILGLRRSGTAGFGAWPAGSGGS